MKQHRIKVRLLSMLTALTMIMSLFGAMPLTASAAETSAASIKLGDYVRLGGITWRCVAFELATNQSNGYPVIDSTNTSTSYTVSNTGDQCYLPLMLADNSIGDKEFDAAGSNTSGSHGRGNDRAKYGSNYWGDSNIRDWLNSDSATVTYTCGNEPSYKDEAGFLTKFNDTEKAAMKTVTQKSLLAQADKNVPGASGSKLHTYNESISEVVQNYAKAYSEQVTDTMFLLDVQQVYNVYKNLGNYYTLSTSDYWLRSPSSGYSDSARDAYGSGHVLDHEVCYKTDHSWNFNGGVRPAFFLNPSAKFVCGSGTAGNPYKQSHSIGNGKDENEHYTYCTNCKQEFSREAHTYTADDSKHTCSVCGYSEKHTYDEHHICTVCNHACSHSAESQYTTSTEHYNVCIDCKRKTEPEAHTYNAEKANKFGHYCSVCHYDQSHSFGAYEIESQPSSTADGVKKRTCSICGYVERTTFKKSQHSNNSAHNLCNDSDCTIANHTLSKTSWQGPSPASGNSALFYQYSTNYNMYGVIKSGTTLQKVYEFPDILKEKKLYNCLDGTRLTLSDGAYIHIQSGETYSLTDCREGVGDIYGGTNGVIKIDKGGTFDFYEGTITGNSGDGIIVNNGTMNLYGGTIMNNTGAAIINNGTLNIYGGTIMNNTGGGIIGTGTINFKKVDCSTGNPVIANNTIDGVPCNVKGAETITVTALGSDASIGFSSAADVTAGSPVDISANGGKYYSRFVSDNGDYTIIKSGSKIQLIAAHSVLEHHAAKAATCTEGGVDEYWSCVDCNRLYSDKDGNTEIYAIPTTEATGHSITYREEVSPTCTESGTGEYWECTSCGTLFSDENGETIIDNAPTINATGHRLMEHEAVAATCTESGNKAYWECMGCDKLFSDENGTTETTLENTVIAAKGHTWGAWTVKTPATETAKGEEQRECSVCHTTETRDIPVLGHTHTMTAHAAKAATCTESGNIAYWECSGCNKLFSDENGTTEITKADTIIAAKGHTEVEIPAVAATCTKGGKTAGVKCSVCGRVLTAPTETVALGHSWSAWEITKSATETEAGEKSRECSRCNETETQVIPATGHTCDWGDWTITTAPTLTATGKAQRVCKTNAAHTESADLPVLTDTTVWTYEEIKAPTQDTDGEGKYTSVYGEVKITLPATGADKFSIRYEGGNAIVNAPTAGTYTVLFAAYDGSGRLTSLSAQTVTVEKGETTVAPQGFTANGTVKVMLWESVLSMKPLCTADTHNSEDLQ